MVAKRVAQQRVKHLQKTLEDHLGSSLRDERRSVVSQLIFNIIARNWTWQGAQRVFEHFIDQFVDWNEVRISPVTEIAHALEREGAPNAEKKAKNIKKVLLEIYGEHHKVSLDFLQETDPDKAKQMLQSLSGTTERVIDSVLLFSLDHPVVPAYSPITRVLKRTGVVEHSDEQEKIRQAMLEIVPKRDLDRFCRLLIEHGERTCVIKTPKCKTCVLKTWCPEPERQVKLQAEAKQRAKEASKKAKERAKAEALAAAREEARAAEAARKKEAEEKKKKEAEAKKKKKEAEAKKKKEAAAKAKAKAKAKKAKSKATATGKKRTAAKTGNSAKSNAKKKPAAAKAKPKAKAKAKAANKKSATTAKKAKAASKTKAKAKSKTAAKKKKKPAPSKAKQAATKKQPAKKKPAKKSQPAKKKKQAKAAAKKKATPAKKKAPAKKPAAKKKPAAAKKAKSKRK